MPLAERRRYNAPLGSLVYWTGGSKGYGHVCFALGGHVELSVDVDPARPGAADARPFSWFGEHWPLLHYAGWSWFFGAIDCHPNRVRRGLG